MYRVDRNNFYNNQKKATIFTPQVVSKFLFKLINKKIPKGLVVDPCVGKGSLLKPFLENGYEVLGIDIVDQGFEPTKVKNYLTFKVKEIKKQPKLVIMNPPFNIDQKTKEYIKKNYKGRPLLPEIWLKKALELFGKKVPIVMFAPYGFRLNQTLNSKRWKNFENGTYPKITSIVSLPKNIFKGVCFHSEVLFFNIKGLESHYFFNE